MVIPRRCGWTAQKGPHLLLVVLSALVLMLPACSAGGGLGARDAGTVADGSVIEVAGGDGTWETLSEGRTVAAGSRIRAGDGPATLQLRDAAVSLAAGALAELGSDTVDLESGEVLVEGDGVRVRLGDTTIAGSGVFRVAAGVAARAAVYEGEATVHRPAQERQVPALRELDLSAFRLAASPAPLRYREGDTWDQELLADALTFDGEAARLTRGIERELGSRPLRPRFYRQYAAPAVVSLLADGAAVSRGRAFGPPADVLLALFVSEAAAGTAPLAPVVEQILGLRDQGARWGLIAVELDIPSSEVVAAIDQLGQDELALAGSGATVSEEGAGDGSSDGATSSAPPDDGAGSGSDGGGTAVGSTSGGTGSTSSSSSGGGSVSTGGSGGSSGGGGGGSDGGGDDDGGSGGGTTGGGGSGGGGGLETGAGEVVDDVVKTLDDTTAPLRDDSAADSLLP